MSIAKRLFNVARAEVGSVFRSKDEGDERLDEELARLKLRAKERPPSPPRSKPDEDSERRARSEERPRVHAEDRAHSASREPDLAKWYANLELPLGASLEEVRAAYRRLMRRYHPDRHRSDPTFEAAASELVLALREAHDGLVAHLSKR
ncbi:MAG: J domain-containing protein [Deltaproteobacteria bacterium]|nr:J domain-containing protein [Deltaproteobacteria bacterium]